MHREAVGHSLDRKTRELLTELLDYPDVQADWATPVQPNALPMIPMSFVKDGAVLNYFLVTTVGAPQAVAAQELRVECMYPADDETEILHAKLLSEPATTH